MQTVLTLIRGRVLGPHCLPRPRNWDARHKRVTVPPHVFPCPCHSRCGGVPRSRYHHPSIDEPPANIKNNNEIYLSITTVSLLLNLHESYTVNVSIRTTIKY